MIGAVLTGGRSSRFGSTKALAPVGDGLMGQMTVSALREAGCDPVVAVGGDEGHALGVPVVNDRNPHSGPLAAVATILVWAKTGHVLVAPCDLPLLRSTDLAPMANWAETASASKGALAVIEGRSHPIVAVWPASSGILLAKAVRQGVSRLGAAMEVIDFDEVVVSSRVGLDADTPEELKHLLGPGLD